MEGVAPKLGVCGAALLELPERLDPLVRLPEEAQSEHGNSDDEQGGTDERDEQLCVDSDGQAADGTDERIVARAQRPPCRVPYLLRLVIVHHGLRASTRQSPRPYW